VYIIGTSIPITTPITNANAVLFVRKGILMLDGQRESCFGSNLLQRRATILREKVRTMAKNMPIREIARQLGVSRSVIARAL